MQLTDPQTLTEAELVALYDSVGWSAYTRDPQQLRAAIRGAHRVAAARVSGELVGLARTISDGVTIVYLQDVLVRPDRQGQGIGALLVRTLLAEYPGVRQKVLITDNEARQAAFYTALGFTETSQHDPPVRAYVQFGGQA